MINYVGTGITIFLNLLCLTIRKQSKTISLLSCIWLFILFYGNNSNPDYSGYMWRYNAQSYYSSMEIGYSTLSAFLHSYNLEYKYVVLAQIVISIPFIVFIIKKTNGNLHLIISIYLMVFFTMDIIQIRNYVGLVAFTAAIILLTEKRRILYIAFVLFASLFQIAYIIYMPFVFLSFNTRFSKKAVRIISSCVIILCIIALINKKIILAPISFISNLLLGSSEKNVYVGNYINLGFILYFLATFINILVCNYIKNRTSRFYEVMSREGNKNFNIIKYSKILALFSNLSCVFLPLLMLNSNYLRFVRNQCLSIILLLAMFFVHPDRNKRDSMPVILVLLFSGVWFLSIGTGNYCQEILENNFILGIGW